MPVFDLWFKELNIRVETLIMVNILILVGLCRFQDDLRKVDLIYLHKIETNCF
jgi:hypothetical protein